MDDKFNKEASGGYSSAMDGRDILGKGHDEGLRLERESKAGNDVLNRCLDNAEDVATARMVFFGIYEWLRKGKRLMCLEEPFNDETLNTAVAVVFEALEKRVGICENGGGDTLEEVAENSCRACKCSHSDEWERIKGEAEKGKAEDSGVCEETPKVHLSGVEHLDSWKDSFMRRMEDDD